VHRYRAAVLYWGVEEAARALERMGVSLSADEPEVADAGLDSWRVRQQGHQFVATNDELPRLRIALEMVGKGKPRILEWDVKKPPFAGIGVLRFEVGSIEGASGPEVVEDAAIIDLQTNTVVSVVVQKQGKKRRSGIGMRSWSLPAPTASQTSSSKPSLRKSWRTQRKNAILVEDVGLRRQRQDVKSSLICCSSSNASRAQTV
jgi:hypothetical protein